jgi:DNA-binding transcriptional MerR regulator
MDEWLTIAEIAEKTGIPENTARRYAAKFSEFLGGRSFGRATKYPPDAMEVINRISQFYQSGKTSDEINEILKRENIQVINIDVEEESQPAPTSLSYDFMDEFRRTNSMILATLQQTNTALEVMANQQKEILLLRQALDQRERELLERIRKLEEVRHVQVPWWKFWAQKKTTL